MNLIINGEDRTFTAVDRLDALVEQLGMKSDRVAIELNRNIVPRDRWAQTPLKDGDQLEIVHFVGGGKSSESRRFLRVRAKHNTVQGRAVPPGSPPVPFQPL